MEQAESCSHSNACDFYEVRTQTRRVSLLRPSSFATRVIAPFAVSGSAWAWMTSSTARALSSSVYFTGKRESPSSNLPASIIPGAIHFSFPCLRLLRLVRYTSPTSKTILMVVVPQSGMAGIQPNSTVRSHSKKCPTGVSASCNYLAMGSNHGHTYAVTQRKIASNNHAICAPRPSRRTNSRTNVVKPGIKVAFETSCSPEIPSVRKTPRLRQERNNVEILLHLNLTGSTEDDTRHVDHFPCSHCFVSNSTTDLQPLRHPPGYTNLDTRPLFVLRSPVTEGILDTIDADSFHYRPSR